LYDILLNETEAGLVGFQLDIFWMIKGGQNPLEYFREHPGRFETWHVKDMGEDGKSCSIGKGSIDYPEIFQQADLSGMKRFFVEQEQYTGLPIEDVAESFKFIEKNLI
jgi:sugar phosphate isomerase/epimerase